jgi:hypothetical protein
MTSPQQVVELLSPTGGARGTLYLNRARVEELYTQIGPRVDEIVLELGLDAKVGASFFGLAQLEAGGQKKLAGSTTVDPVMKAMLLEAIARKRGDIVDLSNNDHMQSKWLYFVGDGAILGPGEALTHDRIDLPDKVISAIQSERTTQEQWLGKDGAPGRAILWVARGREPLASVASEEWIDRNALASHHCSPPFGILGRLERKITSVVFIAPVWLWRDRF